LAQARQARIESWAAAGWLSVKILMKRLMHSKYLVRDGNTDDAAVFLGSANYTNDSWRLQENNLLQLRYRPLAAYFSKNFTDLLAAGRIAVLSKAMKAKNFGALPSRAVTFSVRAK
jgi:phosphatidylserine/phosphatidylglycerophosphate/cardiolipin synthase-like enzyme